MTVHCDIVRTYPKYIKNKGTDIGFFKDLHIHKKEVKIGDIVVWQPKIIFQKTQGKDKRRS